MLTCTFYPDDKRYVFDSEFEIRTADGGIGSKLITTAEMTASVHPADREAFATAFYPCLLTAMQGIFGIAIFVLTGPGRAFAPSGEACGAALAANGKPKA